VTGSPGPSPQTLAVLRSFLLDPAEWRYGYDIAKETGLRSGTLYPILARLAERAQLDRQWESEPAPGRPPRHLYRLTDTGLVAAREALAAAAARRQSRHRSSLEHGSATRPAWMGF
jgi:DNA-binding PadR family transcriptional regulator